MKLTLNINKHVVEQAETYAQTKNTSLSKLVENHLASLPEQKTANIQITPLVEGLSGVIELENDFDYRKDYNSHLIQKQR